MWFKTKNPLRNPPASIRIFFHVVSVVKVSARSVTPSSRFGINQKLVRVILKANLTILLIEF